MALNRTFCGAHPSELKASAKLPAVSPESVEEWSRASIRAVLAAATATDPGSVTVSSAAPSTSPDDKYGLMGPSSKADPHLGREDALREAAREGVEQVLGDEEDTE